ncbi:MAG TPA: hypothetical protein VK864_11805, partial [Longimicrobiales bacterium]|nr:hypothetical protein [Longimicrobiales bacterium]
MRRQLLALTTSTFILACLGMTANAQPDTGGAPKMQEGQPQQQGERAPPRRFYRDDDDDWDEWRGP